MKNFKKLFVVLPLLLVMVLATLPVSAELKSVEKVMKSGQVLDLALDFTKWNILDGETTQYPVWAAEPTTKADASKNEAGNKLNSLGAGWIKVLNDGLPVGWVEANPAVAGAFQVGTYAVQNLAWFQENHYSLNSYWVNNIELVDTKILVPQSWVKGYKETPTYVYKEDSLLLIKAGETVEESDLDSFGIKVENNVATKGSQKVKVERVAKSPDTTTPVTLTAVKDSNATPTGKFTADKKVGKLGTTDEATLQEFFDQGLKYVLDANGDASYYFEVPAEYAFKFSANFYRFGKGDAYEDGLDAVYTSQGHTYVNYGGKNGVVELVRSGSEPESIVEETLSGVLVIVEKDALPVTINHHYLLDGGEEIKKTEEGNFQEKNVVLTPNNIKLDWLKPVAGFEYDPAQTKVEPVTVNKTLINGEVFTTGYTVDLFYTAVEEADESDIEAAFNNTEAGVNNQQNVANLPATGAASNLAVVLSSAALVVVGLFLKK